ncbi:MAG: amidohydrolase family protein, partial [Planctomycetota bacterium]|nr:amidohydrolase family protein [Planctomycetota bacterium]
GLRVTTEVTPHHLYYDQDNAQAFSTPSYLQCNPPIRTRLDRIALIEGLRSGDIECLATDHAPHTLEEKDRGISGVTQLDTFGAFLFWLLEEGFDLQTIQRACCEVPGRFLGRYLPHRYGRVEPGFVGSLTVLKKESFTVRRSGIKSRAGWSPFEGVTFPGRVSHTIVRGNIYPQLD